MKSIRFATLALVLLAAAGLATYAEGFSLELGALAYDFNSTGASQGSGAVTNSADFSPDISFNGSYSMKLDDSTKLKLGLFAEDMMGTISPSYVFVGRAEPYADLTMGALSARVSFPLYLLGYDTTNDPKYAEIGSILDSYYKGINLGTYYNSSNSFLFTNYENVAYKLSFDKSTALVFSASTEIGFVPAFWLYDVKPQVTFIYGPVQLDVKESIYFADGLQNPSWSDTGYNLRFFTDPKVTFNFASVGVPGLKVYVGASLFTYQTVPSTGDSAWYGNASGKAKAFGSSITPGISYTVGPFSVEAIFKFHNYDDSVSNPAAKDPTFDPALKFSYTLSF